MLRVKCLQTVGPYVKDKEYNFTTQQYLNLDMIEQAKFQVVDVETLSVKANTIPIPTSLYDKLNYLGLIPNEVRKGNEGLSDYSKHTIQPWSIWLDYSELTSFDHDILKRVLRTKEGDSRELDYKKIIHICEERLRQLNLRKEK